MYKIAIIGAGQLGSRHLQGLAKIELESELFIVDPSSENKKTARERFDEVKEKKHVGRISFHDSIRELPDKLDLVIISTNSDVRAEVTKQLIFHARVNYILFEKVLFQEIGEYEEIGILLDTNNIKAWVNCPRRIYPLYNRIMDFMGTVLPVSISVSGGNWGLGCNSIHFIDLASFLNISDVPGIDVSYLDPGIIESKRPGFIEFTGMLMARFENGANLKLESIAGSKLPAVIEIYNTERKVMVMEYLHQAYFIDSENNYTPVIQSFEIPFQSALTGQVAKEIILLGHSGLASFAESSKLHEPIIIALAGKLKKEGLSDTGRCKIT